ncbi:MAG: aldo/keto reductase [Armatimonadetes bacterium]|nr:aldo/keto reductase [Armatimonadota bacterium]
MAQLETRTLGRTGLTVTRMAAGGHFTNGPKAHEDHARRVAEIHHMIDSGIRYIDIQWDPEELAMAEVLRTRASEVTVAWPLHGVTGKGAGMTAQYVVDYCHDHQKRYGIEHVDILLWVALELYDDTADHVLSELRAGFEQVKAEGFCDHMAFSCHHSPAMAMRGLDAADLFSVMMLPYGPLNPGARDEVLPRAQALGVGAVAMKPFVGGDGLFNQAWQGKWPELAPWAGSGTPFQSAIRWVLADPNVDCTVPGMHSVAEIDELVAAADQPLTADDEALLDAYRAVQASPEARAATWEFLRTWLP